MEAEPTHTDTRTSAAQIQNTARQDATVPMMPPRIGPRAGAVPRTRAPTPINAPIFERGERVRMIVNIRGVTIPVPMPWIRRPANRSGYVGARAATSAPVKIEPAAVKNSERGVKRRWSQPVIGMTMETTSR